MSEATQTGLFLVLIGAAIGVVATLIGVAWTNSAARKLARETGAFHRPDIRITLFNQEIDESAADNKEVWCFVHKGNRAVNAVFPLQFQILNAGDKGTSELVVTLTTQKDFLTDDVRTAHVVPAVLSDEFKRASHVAGELREISYQLRPLGPKGAAGISEPLILPRTYKRPINVDTTTADDIEVRAFGEITFAALLNIVVFSTDMPAVQRSVSVMSVPASDALEVAAVLKEDMRESIRDYLATLSPIRRFLSPLLKGSWLTYKVVAFEPFDYVGDKRRGVYIAADSEDAKIKLTHIKIRLPTPAALLNNWR